MIGGDRIKRELGYCFKWCKGDKYVERIINICRDSIGWMNWVFLFCCKLFSCVCVCVCTLRGENVQESSCNPQPLVLCQSDFCAKSQTQWPVQGSSALKQHRPLHGCSITLTQGLDFQVPHSNHFHNCFSPPATLLKSQMSFGVDLKDALHNAQKYAGPQIWHKGLLF